jgi:sigma-B regulation protein RsbU (phosphoserine phosphatase)
VPRPPGVETGPPLPGELLADLLALVGEIGAVLDPEALLPTIAQKLRRIVDYRILDIFLPDADGFLVPAHVEGYQVAERGRFRLRPGDGIVGTAAATREVVFVPDVSRDPRYVSFFPGVVAELALPLVNQDRLVGVLNIEGPAAAPFTPAARTALQVLASHLAIAIENATLYRETRWYADLLATLHEIGKETSSILDLDVLLQRLAEIVRRVVDYETFGILLLDEQRQELVLRQAVNFGAGLERTRLKLSEGLCGAAVRARQPVRVGDVRQDPRYVGLVAETRSELAVPLVHKDRVIGVLDLESTQLDRFSERDVKVLLPLASQVAIAIENARLYDEIVRNDTRLTRELRIARDVQRALFPEGSPRGAGWEASAHFRPARELGGDLYDFYDMGEGLLGVAVGDVAGKGVPAALYAAFVSGTVRSRAYERRAPAAGASRACSARSRTLSSTSRSARCALRARACRNRSTTVPRSGARSRSRRRGFRSGRSTARATTSSRPSSGRETPWSSARTVSPRPAATGRSTAWNGCGRASRRAPGGRPPGSASSSWPTWSASWGTRAPTTT